MRGILDAVDDHARLFPEKIAYHLSSGALVDDSNQVENQLTYQQLITYANKLAFYLHETLQDDHSPLVVFGHKSPLMLVCFLACVKSGRAYCPIDVSVPMERVRDIVIQTASPVVFTLVEFEKAFTESVVITADEVMAICTGMTPEIDSAYRVSSEDVFYIIFTSGSTGTPKGVKITTECLENFVHWALTIGGLQGIVESPTIINQAPLSFDLSVMDLYLSLYLGGTLWVIDRDTQDNMRRLLDSLGQSEADVWVSTPTFANICLSDSLFSSALLPKLKLFLFCGERLTNNTVARLQARFPDAGIVNTYGPTESTVAVTSVLITKELNAQVSPLPVGWPKPGTTILIVDQEGHILPDGERGEIIIVGDTVGIGYLNRDDLTAKSFSQHLVDGRYRRAYRTGDEGYLSAGYLYFCGRIDRQIKMHGYRIEIGDVESNLLKLEEVESAVVLPIFKDDQVNSLTAWVVPRFEVEDHFQAAQRLRKKLISLLPAYMVPKKFVFVETLPMNVNGKVNREALSEA